ncbi:CLUMA_CG007657, isoform A [Clunio marinus]|uniref:CLUMA_CG007657, isoform A n=1 Tax=Clunio marinus TaxID=568069 RepID=A0A1J1I6U3_9DIPT|nr:CLUMA_CG007657, isoform A [Clunio marinus]
MFNFRSFVILCFVGIQTQFASQDTPSPPPPPPSCEAVACEGSDKFCEYKIDPKTCECKPFVCCSPPFCPNGYEVCDSCTNCKCKEGCPEEPCDQPSDIFCSATRDPTTCECLTLCCSVFCPNGIDWDNCHSCSDCACLPEKCPRG